MYTFSMYRLHISPVTQPGKSRQLFKHFISLNKVVFSIVFATIEYFLHLLRFNTFSTSIGLGEVLRFNYRDFTVAKL